VVIFKLVDLKSPSDVKDVGDDGDDDYGVGVGFGGFNPFEDDEEFKIFGELSEKEVTSIFLSAESYILGTWGASNLFQVYSLFKSDVSHFRFV